MSFNKALITLIWILCAATATAEHTLAGKAFQVEILTIGDEHFVTSCLAFHADGRFEIGRNALRMNWAQPADRPDTFVAVTTDDKGLPVPYALGVHGLITSGNVILGTTIDRYGSVTAFIGSEVSACYAQEPRSTPTTDCLLGAQTSGDSARRALSNCVPRPYLDAVSQPWSPQVAPCTDAHCDPALDPLRPANDRAANSQLRNRHFVVNMNDDRAEGECWSFDDHGFVRTPSAPDMTWAPDYLYDLRTTFQAVSPGVGGVGRSYYGKLLGEGVLEVRGIEAAEDRSDTVYGIGQETRSCTVR